MNPQAPDGFDPQESLTRAILARTSGPVCSSARERLCPWVDGELDAARTGLLALHLETCPECRELAAVVSRLAPILASMAEVEPDPRFLRDVLARTSRSAQPGGFRSLADRLAGRAVDRAVDLGRRLWQRPRAAMELAYGCTMIALLLFGPLGDPGRSTEESRDPADAAAAFRSLPLVDGISELLASSSNLQVLRQETAERLEDTLRSLDRKISDRPAYGFRSRVNRVVGTGVRIFQATVKGAESAGQAAWRGDFFQAFQALAEARDTVGRIWSERNGAPVGPGSTLTPGQDGEPSPPRLRPDERAPEGGRVEPNAPPEKANS